jgi:hypothetical protein
MLLGADPARVMRIGDPVELIAMQAIAKHADVLLDEQHERLAMRIAREVSNLFG